MAKRVQKVEPYSTRQQHECDDEDKNVSSRSRDTLPEIMPSSSARIPSSETVGRTGTITHVIDSFAGEGYVEPRPINFVMNVREKRDAPLVMDSRWSLPPAPVGTPDRRSHLPTTVSGTEPTMSKALTAVANASHVPTDLPFAPVPAATEHNWLPLLTSAANTVPTMATVMTTYQTPNS
ncbi:hypothetical protein MTO96_013311 [Rhipicephalus appendiculatus]